MPPICLHDVWAQEQLYPTFIVSILVVVTVIVITSECTVLSGNF